MKKHLCIIYILMTCLGIMSEALAATIYRCVGADGVPHYSEKPLGKGYKCNILAKIADWEFIGTYGEGVDEAAFSYKFFDEKRPATKIWVQVDFTNIAPIAKGETVYKVVTLYEVNCIAKQIRYVQYSRYMANGIPSTNNIGETWRYATPGTTDDIILNIACTAPSK